MAIGTWVEMGRFLFVEPPLLGHINPTLAVGRILMDRGHEVVWTGFLSGLTELLPDIPIRSVPGMTNAEIRGLQDAWYELRGLEAFRFCFEGVLRPIAKAMQAGLDDVVRDFGPDVLVVDHQAFAGAVVARKRNLKWATFVTTPASLVPPVENLPGVKSWLDGLYQGIFGDCTGGEGGTSQRIDLSPYLVLMVSTRELVGVDGSLPACCEFVGPCVGGRADKAIAFPWEDLRDVPRVLITLGTINVERGKRFFCEVMDGLAGEAIQLILVADRGMFGTEIPSNVIVRLFVPQVSLMSHVQAVVCHGGHNTVLEALAHGVPLVIAPVNNDQPVIARQVVEAGAGLRVRYHRANAAEIRDAVHRVLREATFREGAERIRASFEASGGPSRAADLLERLLETPHLNPSH